MHPDLDPLLRAQHGIVSRRQLLTAALTSRQIQRHLSARRLLQVMPGIYRDPAVNVTLEQRAMAAVLAGGPGAMVSHRMSVALWKMRGYACDMLEISAPREIERPQLMVHRYSREPPNVLLRGIPVTTPERTMLDCAPIIAVPTMGRFLETWLSTGVVKLSGVEAEMSRSPRHPGVGPLQSALARRMITSEEADSPAEALLGELLVRHGLAPPELHRLVTVSTGSVFELDWSYPDFLVAFELDGYGVHLRSFAAFENDRLRRNELEIDGWAIMNFTRNLVMNRPSRVIDQVRRMIEGRRDHMRM